MPGFLTDPEIEGDEGKKKPGREAWLFKNLTRVFNFTIIHRKLGARRNKLEEPLVMDQEYSIQWRELRVNLAELAKLRYLEGWDRNKLDEHYQRTLYAITNYCQAMRKKNFNLEGLTEAEKEKIRWAYQN